MLKGTVKWVQAELGVGFIETEDGGKDVLLMQSALRPVDFKPLKVGEELEFEVQESVSGLVAINVKRVETSS